MEFVIPNNVYIVNSVENTAFLKLDIPENYDVQSMMFTQDPPEGLKAIHVIIGEQRIARIDKAEFGRNNDMLSVDLCACGLKLSKSSYMNTYFKFEFDKEYLQEREESEMVPEMREVVTHSDSEEEIYDGYSYSIGKRVSRHMEPTGNQVIHIIKGVYIECPDILVNMVKPSSEEHETTPVWQPININGTENHEYIQRLREKFKLKMADDRYEDLDAAIASKQTFTGKLENTIRYSRCMAGLCYQF